MNLPFRAIQPPAQNAADAPAPIVAGEFVLNSAVASLLGVLDRLQDQLTALSTLASAKLQALRAADADALLSGARSEQQMLEALVADQQTRDAEIARLAQVLRIESSPLPRLTVLAERLPEPHASKILAKSAGLRALSLELQKKNRHAADVARQLHKHVVAVFADIANAGRESVTYGRSGQHETGSSANWFDAVG